MCSADSPRYLPSLPRAGGCCGIWVRYFYTTGSLVPAVHYVTPHEPRNADGERLALPSRSEIAGAGCCTVFYGTINSEQPGRW